MRVCKGLGLWESVFASSCNCRQLGPGHQGQDLYKVCSDLAGPGKAPPEGLVDGKAPLAIRELDKVGVILKSRGHLQMMLPC